MLTPSVPSSEASLSSFLVCAMSLREIREKRLLGACMTPTSHLHLPPGPSHKSLSLSQTTLNHLPLLQSALSFRLYTSTVAIRWFGQLERPISQTSNSFRRSDRIPSESGLQIQRNPTKEQCGHYFKTHYNIAGCTSLFLEECVCCTICACRVLSSHCRLLEVQKNRTTTRGWFRACCYNFGGHFRGDQAYR